METATSFGCPAWPPVDAPRVDSVATVAAAERLHPLTLRNILGAKGVVPVNTVVIIDEIEKAGDVRSTSGTRHSLTEALLSLVEPATAPRWDCPYYRPPFDMLRIGWVMTANSRRGLPEPLLSR